MRHYDEELRELQIQAATKNRLEAMLKELWQQKNILGTRVEELSAQKAKEQLDVERLEKNSLVNYFYQVVGKLDDKLTKERQEAYEAAVKYDAAYSELQAIEAELSGKEMEYGRVRRSDEWYQEVQLKELEEAISAGRHADQTADLILESLSSAQSWGTFDLLGGGLIADMAKHSHLDEAQEKVERLQGALRRFKTELADVEIIADMQVSIDGFLRFADYFFDGLFADWSVMNRISEARGQVENVKKQIQTVLSKLNVACTSVKAKKNSAENIVQELVKKAAL